MRFRELQERSRQCSMHLVQPWLFHEFDYVDRLERVCCVRCRIWRQCYNRELGRMCRMYGRQLQGQRRKYGMHSM